MADTIDTSATAAPVKASDTASSAPASAATTAAANDSGASAPASAAAASDSATAAAVATDTTTTKKKELRWLPLESAPEVLNPFLKGLGVDSSWGFCDIYGTDPDLLNFVPKPCAAVCLLFPSSPAIKEFKKKQHAQIVEKGQKTSDKLHYITQLDEFGNACGSIAAMHAVANSLDLVTVADGGLLKNFVKSTDGMSADDRGKALLHCGAIKAMSDKCASSDSASTQCPNAEDKVMAHFISFVYKDGSLFEMDGRKAFPIHHGSTSRETLLTDAVKVIKTNFMAVETKNPRFSMMALAKIK